MPKNPLEEFNKLKEKIELKMRGKKEPWQKDRVLIRHEEKLVDAYAKLKEVEGWEKQSAIKAAIMKLAQWRNRIVLRKIQLKRLQPAEEY